MSTTPSTQFTPIRDRHGRTFEYLRIAVLDQCNLRCVYCMPESGIRFLAKDNLLTRDEIARVVRAFAGVGVSKVRFTGGEPLIRPDIVELVADAASTPGVDGVHLTTNALLLADALPALREAGLRGVNVSLDTLRSDRFRMITRRDGFDDVLAAVDASIGAGLSVKINAVMLNGMNLDEVGDFVRFAKTHAVTVRFIELMPFDARQIWEQGSSVRAAELVDAVRRADSDLSPTDGSATETHVFTGPGYRGSVAVIPAFTRTLCGACDRIRVTADGQIRNCLFSEHEYDLMHHLRTGDDEAALVKCLRRAVGDKAVDGWAAARTDVGDHPRVSMTQIGG
jgi:cyclic pyranopterin phosphate synthase